MPYINIKITREGVTAEQKAELIKGATELLARVLNKNPKTTIVTIEEVDMDSWGIGGDPVEIAREKGEAQDAKIARLEADKEEQEKELENLKKLLLQDGKKEDIPPLPEEETTEEIPVFMLNNNGFQIKLYPETVFALKFIFHYTLSKRSQKTSAYRHQYPLTSGICLLSVLF